MHGWYMIGLGNKMARNRLRKSKLLNSQLDYKSSRKRTTSLSKKSRRIPKNDIGRFSGKKIINASRIINKLGGLKPVGLYRRDTIGIDDYHSVTSYWYLDCGGAGSLDVPCGTEGTEDWEDGGTVTYGVVSCTTHSNCGGGVAT